jgi:long-chain acyl-CoA synthetase
MNAENNAEMDIRSSFSNHWSKTFIHDIESDSKYTYGEILKIATSFEEWVSSRGFEASQALSVAPKNGHLPIAIYLSGAFFGRRVHVIDPTRGDADIDAMLETANVDRLLTNADDLLDRDVAVSLTDFDPTQTGKESALSAVDEINMEKPFLTTFTSGTTGTPKGVVHSLGNLLHTSKRFGERFDFDSADTFYHALPMAYMAGILNGLLLPMVHGSTVVIGPRAHVTNAGKHLDLAADAGVNVFWFTPTILSLLSRMAPGPYEGPADAIGCVATEPLPGDLRQEFEREYEIPLYETYGLSETLFLTTEHPDHPSREGVGPFLEDVEYRFGDDGELLVNVPWALKGYLGEETPLDEGWFATGDLARVKNETVVISGRKKDVIVRGGVNISPERVEQSLHESGLVEDVAIIGRDAPTVGEEIVCAFVPEEDFDETSELREYVVDTLGSDYRIDEFVSFRSLPRDDEGELDRDAVLKRLAK